jgi:signal transduction histidine kinase
MGEAISPRIVELDNVPSSASDASLRDALKAAIALDRCRRWTTLRPCRTSASRSVVRSAVRAAVLPCPRTGPITSLESWSRASAHGSRSTSDTERSSTSDRAGRDGDRERAADEEERRRAEALAELDRAKTAFFANVSHEFRTPLTLLLGPLEEALRRKENIAPDVRDDLTAAHRNALRLLRLVNTLLDFSRIEAGRVDAAFEPTPLADYTAELVSTFRSATDRAGLGLEIIAEDVRAGVGTARCGRDRAELVSNAFKHTFEGTITTTLRTEGGNAVLEVRDTGWGSPTTSFRIYSSGSTACLTRCPVRTRAPASGWRSCGSSCGCMAARST